MDTQVSQLFLAFSAKKLQQMLDHLESCTAKLTDDQIWSRGAPHENSIGNLILHLCGNARQWIIAGVAGEPDTRNRDAEFSAQGGMSIAQLNSHLKSTFEQAIAVIATLPPERLTEQITPQDSTVSILEAVYQVVGHVQQHTGQIIFATKIYSGQDLGLYRPKAPSPK